MTDTILQGEKITRVFHQGKAEVKVLDEIDIKIYEKDFTVIMGPSGAGKSTPFVQSKWYGPDKRGTCALSGQGNQQPFGKTDGKASGRGIWVCIPADSSGQQPDSFGKCAGGRVCGQEGCCPAN